MIPRALAAAAAVTAVLAGLAAPGAKAATTCAHSLPGLLEVRMSSHADQAYLGAGGGTISVRGPSDPVACSGAPATTASIDTILVVDESDDFATPAGNDGSTYVQINEPASFGPGNTAEPGQVSEIEVLVDTKAGYDSLAVGGAGPQALLAGNDGVSWTSDDDADLLGVPFDRLLLYGGPQQDSLTARGTRGTGAPLSTVKQLSLVGGQGADTLVGGNSPTGDDLVGGPGPDDMIGFAGPDKLEPGPGDDVVQGGPGQDTVDLDEAAAGVRVDLADIQPQDTGEGLDTIVRIEHAIGSAYADTLLGDAGANVLTGGNGDDTLEGRGGADELHGQVGSDAVSYAEFTAAVNVDLSRTPRPRTGTSCSRSRT